MAIVAVIRRALEASDVDPDSLILIEATDHETTNRFMQLNDYVDVIIQRYINLKGTDKDVFLIRDGQKIPYSEVIK